MPSTCATCGTPTESIDLDLDGVCPDCQERAAKERAQPVRLLGNGRPAPGYRHCEYCGKGIAGRSNRRTCDAACRVALHRARQRLG